MIKNEKHMFSKGHLIDDKYSVQFHLSDYSNAQVYSAKDNSGKLVRVKVYNSSKLKRVHFHSSGELLEINILKSLDHPNIIKLFDFGFLKYELNEYNYLVTEFISGESLLDKFKRKNPLSLYAAIPIIIELLQALHKLHSGSNPIIHNGISLKNIFLDYTNENKERTVLSNFHNARYFNEKKTDYEFEDLFLPYLSPETFNNVMTPQTDLFAVGAMFYHLVVGIPPWLIELPDKYTINESLIERLANERRKPLAFIKDDEIVIDHQIINTIKKALALDVDQRFHSANEFIQALKREVEVEFSDSTTSAKPKHHQKKRPVKNSNEPSGFQQIAGMEFLKEMLRDDVIKALNEPELYKSYGITIPNGMLLYGPPGCGKTFIAEKFAEEVGFNFVMIKPSDIQSKYINATQENINKLFDEAKENAPTIIFFDELDALVPIREGDLHHMHATAVNEFLAQMTNCSEAGIFIIAATNRPERIDPAMLRTGRIDKIIYLPPPDKIARQELFKIYLKDRPIEFDIDSTALADKTENYVSSDIKFIVDESSRAALKMKNRISMDILLKIINKTRPSVSISEINRYKDLESSLNENIGDQTNKKTPFGFTINDNEKREE
jgi:transitional endoplasmic reticulum ATPase